MNASIPTAKQLFERLSLIAFEIAKEEGLDLKSFTRNTGKKNAVGICSYDGHIKIRIRTQGLIESVLYEENGRTLAHELAHLKYFNHSREFYEYAGKLCQKVGERLGKRVQPEKFYVR